MDFPSFSVAVAYKGVRRLTVVLALCWWCITLYRFFRLALVCVCLLSDMYGMVISDLILVKQLPVEILGIHFIFSCCSVVVRCGTVLST